MNISNEIIRITINSVIVVIPALVRTEFFIGTAANFFAAIETFLFHSTLSFDKDIKNTNAVYEFDLDIKNTNDVYKSDRDI